MRFYGFAVGVTVLLCVFVGHCLAESFEDVVTCDFIGGQIVWTKSCVSQPNVSGQDNIFALDKCTPVWLPQCEWRRRGAIITDTPCPPGYSSSRPSFKPLCEREVRFPLIQSIKKPFSTQAECQKFIAGVNCESEVGGCGEPGSLVVSRYDCTLDDQPAATPIEPLPVITPTAAEPQDGIPRRIMRCIRSGNFSRAAGVARCVHEGGPLCRSNDKWRIKCMYWCQQKRETVVRCPNGMRTAPRDSCPELLAQFPEQKTSDTSFINADVPADLEWDPVDPVDIQHFESAQDCLGHLKALANRPDKPVCEDLNQDTHAIIRAAICPPASVELEQSCIAEPQTPRPVMPGLALPPPGIAAPPAAQAVPQGPQPAVNSDSFG